LHTLSSLPKDILHLQLELAQIQNGLRVSTDEIPDKDDQRGWPLMKNPLIFVSSCPSCGRQQLQHGHTRRALTKLIESRQIIDAYCLECDVVWPVTAEERALVACAITTGQGSMGPDCMTGLIDNMQQIPQVAH
jgi:hypothetical protein